MQNEKHFSQLALLTFAWMLIGAAALVAIRATKMGSLFRDEGSNQNIKM